MALKYLLDTHSLIWFQENNAKIPSRVMDIMQDPGNTIFFSQISLFEIAIKQTIGKLPGFRSNTDEIYQQGLNDDFLFLQIKNDHLSAYQQIPLKEEHRDPFDRLILATAYIENAIILSADKNFKLYTDMIDVFW